MAVIKLPYRDFDESTPIFKKSPIPGGPGYYNEDNPGYGDSEFPSPFGQDLFDRVQAPTDKGGAFQALLNRGMVAQAPRGIVPNSTITNTESPGAPSQMPMDMGGGIPTHGITGNIGGVVPGTAIGNMSGMATDLQKGIEALKEAKEKGGLMNEETRRMMDMLQGY